MRLRVAIGADHGGFSLKKDLVGGYLGTAYDVIDIGAGTFTPDDDYPDISRAVALAVVSGQAGRGIIICGSGVGACITANKVRGIRACLCHDTYSARQGVEHDDMNVLCLGARVIGRELAIELVKAFLSAGFSGEERHRRRLKKVLELERRAFREE